MRRASRSMVVERGLSSHPGQKTPFAGLLLSTRPVKVHLLLLARPIDEDPLMETILLCETTSGRVAGIGDSVPFRLKIDTLRLAMLLELGC